MKDGEFKKQETKITQLIEENSDNAKGV